MVIKLLSGLEGRGGDDSRERRLGLSFGMVEEYKQIVLGSQGMRWHERGSR